MVKLKRELTLWELTLTGIGIILGAGIYVLIGEAAGLSGNMIWMSFIIAGVVAALTGLSYAELASLFPKAGAEFVFTEKAFNKRLAFIIGWLLITACIVSASAVALGFAGYFSAFFNTPIILTAIGALIVLSIIQILGIKTSARFAIICAIITILGLLGVIVFGIPYFDSINYFEMVPELGFAGVLSAASLVFFAYIGFDTMINMGEETKNPKVVVPEATIIAIVISTVLYILVAISSVSVMGWEALSQSSAPLADVAAESLGSNAFLILGFVALFATTSTILLILLAASRLTYGMAEGNGLPIVLAKLHPKWKTPWVAIIILLICSSIFVLIGKIGIVANMTNIAILASFFIVNCSAIILRYKLPGIHRNFKIPLSIGKFPIIPFFGALTCVLLIIQMEFEVILFGSSIIIIGFLLSYIFVKDNIKPVVIQEKIHTRNHKKVYKKRKKKK
ncbi:amino acid permease [Candidatus Micrarchaeota archaeon]|nr:amino acid permease [Candidatus Micrarchaeota archaeon]